MARAKAKTPDVVAPVDEPLWKHQEQSISFFSARPFGFDNSDPGTGKTRVQIEVYRRRKDRKRWLIMCPMTLMEAAWGDDIMKYAPELTVSFATAAGREAAFQMQTDVVVLNIDGIKWFSDKKFAKERLKYLNQFDHLTIDEYTDYKHSSSARSKAMNQVKKFFSHRYALSGTGAPNTVMELWHPALIIDGGKRLGTSYFRLRNEVQVPTQIGPKPEHLRWDDKPGATQLIADLLGDITIRHDFEEVMVHVPPNHKDVKEFKLSAKCQKYYDQLARDAILQIDSGIPITAVHAAALRTKLLQAASGAIYDGSEEGSYQILDLTRYELIAGLVEHQKHSLTFFNWKHQRDILSKTLHDGGMNHAIIDGSIKPKERLQIVHDFQEGKYRTVLMHPQTGAHGLTMTRGTRTIVSSAIYAADKLKQLIKRIHRGTQDQVTNTVLVQAKGTVEDLVYAKLNDRVTRLDDLLQQMRERHK
jgi:SNF2 family DNA or RNA helicase